MESGGRAELQDHEAMIARTERLADLVSALSTRTQDQADQLERLQDKQKDLADQFEKILNKIDSIGGDVAAGDILRSYG